MTTATICKHLTIFEGPDGSGKSTSALDYAKQTYARYVHFANVPEVTTGLARMYVEAMLPALLGYRSVVFDRCWLSEGPYGRVFRNGQDRLGAATCRMLERLAMRCGAVVVQCQPPMATCLFNFNSRRGFEMLRSEAQLKDVYLEYLTTDTALPSLMYDYTSTLGDVTDMIDTVKDLQMTRHELHINSAGNLDAKILLVGEKLSNHKNDDPYYQWPFASFDHGGCSQWLTEKLMEAGISERDLCWTNADQLERWDTETLRWFDQIIALGAAPGILLERKGLGHYKVDHPQFHKRFKHSEPYPLISKLKEVIHEHQ